MTVSGILLLVFSCNVVLIGSIVGAFFGTTYARSSFQNAFGITNMSLADKTATSANLTASYLAAAFFGAAAAWPCMEYLGRRWGLRIGSIIFLVGAIIMTVASSDINLICEYTKYDEEERRLIMARCWSCLDRIRSWIRYSHHSHFCCRVQSTPHPWCAHRFLRDFVSDRFFGWFLGE